MCVPVGLRAVMSDELTTTFQKLVDDIHTCTVMESLVCGRAYSPSHTKGKRKRDSESLDSQIERSISMVRETVEHCSKTRNLHTERDKPDCSDKALCKLATFTDDMALEPFQPFLQYVPRLVNVVTVCMRLTLRIQKPG